MNELSLADVAALRGNNDGNGWGNGDGWWIILLFILLGGWGNRGWGNGGNGSNGAGGDVLYPWLNQSEQISNGFANAATQLCNCCADMQMAVASGFANAETAANARQMANMQQAFNAQLATQQGFNGVQSDLCQGFNGVQGQIAAQTSTILAENCADRAALSDGVRDIIASQTAGTQRIIDWLCQDKIDQKNERIQALENQLTMAQLAASQTAQTSQILADNARQTTALEQYLNPAPIPSYTVANPNCCQQNFGCGCN